MIFLHVNHKERKKIQNFQTEFHLLFAIVRKDFKNILIYGQMPRLHTVRSTFAVRETASLGIMGEPRVPPLNPSETIVLSEHYRF